MTTTTDHSDLRALAAEVIRLAGQPSGEAWHKYQMATLPHRLTTILDELDQLRRVIAWANNSLYGSHNFFLSMNGGEPDEHHLDRGIEDLKANVRALSASHPPKESETAEGWVSVPREPTDEMLDAMSDGVATATGNLRNNWRRTYRAMIAAAPTKGGENG